MFTVNIRWVLYMNQNETCFHTVFITPCEEDSDKDTKTQRGLMSFPRIGAELSFEPKRIGSRNSLSNSVNGLLQVMGLESHKPKSEACNWYCPWFLVISMASHCLSTFNTILICSEDFAAVVTVIAMSIPVATIVTVEALESGRDPYLSPKFVMFKLCGLEQFTWPSGT